MGWNGDEGGGGGRSLIKRHLRLALAREGGGGGSNVGGGASVIKHFSFQRFLNLSNPWKPMKTREPGNLDTYVPFSGNLINLSGVETSETYGNLYQLLCIS